MSQGQPNERFSVLPDQKLAPNEVRFVSEANNEARVRAIRKQAITDAIEALGHIEFTGIWNGENWEGDFDDGFYEATKALDDKIAALKEREGIN